MEPLVSIIIPTLNRLQFIKETIRSVSEQTYRNVEIIVSDNGSTSDVKEYIRDVIDSDLRILYRKNTETVTMASHFNQCLHLAKGRYIIYISDDDLISDNFIRLMVDKFESNSSISVGISKTQIINTNGDIVRSIPVSTWDEQNGKNFIDDWLIKNREIPVATFISLFTKTDRLKLSGGFPDFEAGAHIDNAITINLCLMGDIAFVEQATFFYRVYSESFGLSMPLNRLLKASHQFSNYYRINKSKIE
jgi:glycosyltransferase involved in cell wall biosynthesis